jgi:DNA-binding transcriptional ArsR family regulator
MTTVEEQAALFTVLADPTRLKLLKILYLQRESNALCVNALARRLGVTQSAVSQHLRILRTSGLVQGKRQGYRIHYFINRAALLKAREIISDALSPEKQINGIDIVREHNGQTG